MVCSRRTLTIALAVIAWTGRPASAIVIDDFTQGAATVPGPALVNQTNLDPAHVIGGARSVDVERIGSTLQVDAAQGLRFASTDWGYFRLVYGAETPLGVNLTVGGYDRMLIRLGEIAGGFHPIGFYFNLPSSSSSNGRSIYLPDAWDGILLEAPFGMFPVPLTAVNTITIDAFRNPRNTSFEIKSLTTGRRSLEGDFNYDGVVDGLDLDEWKKALGVNTYNGSTLSFVASADANQDGSVNGGDFLIWQRNLGASLPTSVPEPTAGALLLSAISVASFRRRRRRASPDRSSCGSESS